MATPDPLTLPVQQIPAEVAAISTGENEQEERQQEDTVLTLSDILEVCEKVRSASPNWFDLGLALKLSYTDLTNFREMYRGDNKVCLRETLACRLQSDDPLTWGGMCTALRHPTVTRKDVAEAIEGSYQSLERVSERLERAQNSTTEIVSSTESLDGAISEVVSISPSMGELEVDSMEMETQFNKLVAQLCQSLEVRRIDKDSLVFCLLGFNSLKKVFGKTNHCVFRHQRKKLRKCSTSAGVWQIIVDYFSFFDYEMVDQITDNLGTAEDKEKMKLYKANFVEYAKRRVRPVTENISSDSREDTITMVVKLDSTYDDCELNRLKLFKRNLCSILNLNESVLKLGEISKGCIELKFLLPSFITSDIFPLSTDQEHALHSQGVLQLHCGDVHYQAECRSDKGDNTSRSSLESASLPELKFKMATPLTLPGTLFSATGSDSTPEYLTLRRSYLALITHVKEQPGTICDSLFAKGYISTTVRDFVRSRAHSDEEKAQKLMDTVLDKVDRSVYYGFLEILKTEGRSAKPIIARLEECFAVVESELAVQQIPAKVAAISTGGNEQEAIRQQEESASFPELKVKMAAPLTLLGTLSSAKASDSTPEYLTLRRSYLAVITHVKEQPGTICDSLFEKGYISTTVHVFVRSRAHSDEEKAQKLIDTVLDKVKHDRSVYYGFLEILKTEGPLAKSIIARLEECFAVVESELAVQQIPAEVAAISTGGNEQEERKQEAHVAKVMDCEEESEVLITTSTYHHHNSADSGVSTEYRTLRDCYPELVDHVKLQLTTTSSALFSKSYVPNNIHEYSTSDGVSDEKKAKKLLDPVLAKVKLNPDTYHGFVDILGREGPWADDIIKHLKDHFHSIKSEMKQTQHKGLVERASDTKRVLVTVDNREDSKERLYITENIQTLQNLTEEIRQMFQLDGHCIITLQIWDASFNDFVSIKDMNEIQDCCKINAATRKQAQTPQIQTQVVYCGTNIFLGQSNMPANVNPRRQSNTFPRSQGALGAYIVYNKLWKEREVLKVFFKNPEVIRKWKCRNEPMTTTNILAWAAVWNHPFHSNIIPTLEITENIENSDIRVQFLEESSGCWSMVGTNAVGKDITMVLDLSRHPPNVQRSLVIHEFGHALGLEHEHQRSDFWDIVGKHVDLEKMRKDISVQRAPESDDEQGGVGFEKDWEAKIGGGEEEYTAVKSEYDSKSIMHYCFDVKWLKDGVSTLADIETHPDLSNKEKKYLKAILQRSGIGPLPKEPSKLDIQELVKAYETTGRRQKPPLEMTKSFQNPTSNEHVTLDDAHMEEKDTQEPKIWTGRSVLKVYFINPKKLEEWANGTRIDNIMTWASSWNSPLYDQIPRFEETEDNLTADIRVMFSASSGSWSAVGTDVQKVKKMKPTMMLDLKSYNRYFQRYLVIHQFGHALGLEHEHQRMDFWDGIRKHIDTEKMGNDKTTGNYSSVSSKAFKRDWLELGVKAHRESVIPYDPQSIMHWWFAVEWLKDLKYHKLENIKSDSSLTDDEKRFLEAIHARNRKYVLAPSKSDFEYLGEVYSRLGDHEEKATEFESSKVEELLKQVDVNKIKGIWLSTTDVSDSDQAQETWKKIARFTAETNLDLYREIVEKCRL